MAKNSTKSAKPTLAATPLWPHQRQAVNSISKYVKAFAKNKSLGAALTHLPTGTGKTGVIACVSHFLSGLGCVLVLCPRIALREQLTREISGRFFTKLGFSDDLPKSVLQAKHGFPKVDTGELPDTIFVMTIQMLHSLMSRKTADYKLLTKHVDLLVVDEGHYEPAISWRDAVRGIPAPKVIFTATPFRNDLKLFDVNFDHAFSYTFQQAVKDRTIRGVIVHPRAATMSPQSFVDDVIKFYDRQFGTNPISPAPRVIIRCESDARIRQIGQALAAAGRTYILIHENFQDADPTRPHELRSVPDPEHEQALYWVHQFKLLEGIDDPRFQVLAIFDELKTTRSLVQQVGRVIRNPARRAGAMAHFLDHSAGRHEELWDGYLAFDRLIGEKGVTVADFGKGMLAAIRQAQPDVVYIDGRFRSRLTLDAIDPAEELMLPLTVNVFRKTKGFRLAQICDDLEREYAEQDRDQRRIDVGPKTVVFIYLTFRNSPLLRSQCFIECELGATVLREAGDYLCAFDSIGGAFSLLAESTTTVSVDELRRLFPRTKATHLTAVSLHNSNLGPRALRSRYITAARIEDTLPTFDDHSFVCRTAQGYSQHGAAVVRRYVGFGRGKVTDSSHGRARLSDYLPWLDGITTVLASSSKSITSFARFAAHVGMPANPKPTSILLDLRDVEAQFFINDATGTANQESLQIEDACCEVSAGAFSLRANGKTYDGAIEFDSASRRYHIEIPDLDQGFFTQDAALKAGLVRYLNQNQSFRVIPASTGSFYTMGEFYSPIIKFGTKYDDDQIGLLKVLQPAPCLAAIGSEKGTACAPDSSAWDPQSLFSIVDLLGVGHGLEGVFGNPELVVCDDLGTEAADFILAYRALKRVLFIHCKGKGNDGNASLYSASGLQDVCGQATKNLRYFSRYGEEIPPNSSRWHNQAWSGAKGVGGSVSKRIRRKPAGVSTGKAAWNEIQTLIRNPYSDLQVWLFLGRMLSKKEFQKQLTKPKPAAEAQQAAYLLFSTMNDVAAVGARLRVFCSP